MSGDFTVVGLPSSSSVPETELPLAQAEMRAEMNHAKEADTVEITSNPSGHFIG